MKWIPLLALTASALAADFDAALSLPKRNVTSVAFSPTLGHYIGLGFLQRGPDRLGETVRMVDHVRGIDTTCEVVNPVFFDPDGGRSRD